MTWLLERFEHVDLGNIFLVHNNESLAALDFEEHEPRLRKLVARHVGSIDWKPTQEVSSFGRALHAYFKGSLDLTSLQLEPVGTTFQRDVWKALQQIPPGETRTYGQIACAIGNPKAVRAVGLANGQNPIAIVVPCHRVIGANGTLTGYAGGMERKAWLLSHEAQWKETRLP